jgi:hypothetical protein
MSTLSEPGPRHRVPVEHRVLGLDRRTFPFAITALVVYLLWAYLVPAIDDAVPWTDETRPGDVLQVTPDLTLVPSVGWGVQSGLRTTDRTAGAAPPPVLLTKDGVLFRIEPGQWNGSAAELLAQITTITTTTAAAEGFHVTSGANTFVTRDGLTGVLETYAAERTEGVIAALVLEGQGLQIQAVGPPAQLPGYASSIEDMIGSIARSGS